MLNIICLAQPHPQEADLHQQVGIYCEQGHFRDNMIIWDDETINPYLSSNRKCSALCRVIKCLHAVPNSLFRQTWYIPRWVEKKQRYFHFYTHQSAAVLEVLWQGWASASKTTERHVSPSKGLQTFWMDKKNHVRFPKIQLVLWDPPCLLPESAWVISSVVKICMVGQYCSLASNFSCSWLANTGWYGSSSSYPWFCINLVSRSQTVVGPCC